MLYYAMTSRSEAIPLQLCTAGDTMHVHVNTSVQMEIDGETGMNEK
jgi:hypothetical protein